MGSALGPMQKEPLLQWKEHGNHTQALQGFTVYWLFKGILEGAEKQFPAKVIQLYVLIPFEFLVNANQGKFLGESHRKQRVF